MGEYLQEAPVLKVWQGIKVFSLSSIDLETDSLLMEVDGFCCTHKFFVLRELAGVACVKLVLLQKRKKKKYSIMAR